MYFISIIFNVLNVLDAVWLSLFLLVYKFFIGHVAWIKPDLILIKSTARYATRIPLLHRDCVMRLSVTILQYETSYLKKLQLTNDLEVYTLKQLYCVWVIASYSSKVADFNLPQLHLAPT